VGITESRDFYLGGDGAHDLGGMCKEVKNLLTRPLV